MDDYTEKSIGEQWDEISNLLENMKAQLSKMEVSFEASIDIMQDHMDYLLEKIRRYRWMTSDIKIQ